VGKVTTVLLATACDDLSRLMEQKPLHRNIEGGPFFIRVAPEPKAKPRWTPEVDIERVLILGPFPAFAERRARTLGRRPG